MTILQLDSGLYIAGHYTGHTGHYTLLFHCFTSIRKTAVINNTVQKAKDEIDNALHFLGIQGHGKGHKVKQLKNIIFHFLVTDLESLVNFH